MRVRALLVIFAFLLFLSCKKKVEKNEVEIDETKTNLPNGYISISTQCDYPFKNSIFDFSISAYKESQFFIGTSYYKNSVINIFGAPRNYLSFSLNDLFWPETADSIVKCFKYPSFSFATNLLGYNSYVERDTIFPTFSILNVTDTITIYKNALNTFTIINTTSDVFKTTAFIQIDYLNNGYQYPQIMERNLGYGNNSYKVSMNEMKFLDDIYSKGFRTYLAVKFSQLKAIKLQSGIFTYSRTFVVYCPIRYNP